MFKIHAQLIKDCHLIKEIENSFLLLHKNASVHWFILVPKTETKNFLQLEPLFLSHVLAEAKFINTLLLEKLNYSKTNFASIGNIVNQMHLHIIGRNENDACWPLPVWGHLKTTSSYTESQLDDIKNLINTVSINE